MIKQHKSIFTLILLTVLSGPFLSAAAADPMSPAYWEYWNADVQARIDRDIEKNRKAEVIIKLPGNIPAGANIKVEQITHDFIFGSHIFNFNQLGTPERNRKYKDLFGNLFNSATIAFYWKNFEMEPGKPRFKGEYRDTEEYWNKITQGGDPKKESHWRRPASDPVVAFCESKGIRLHGHPIIWGHNKWQYPDWMFEQFCPKDEKEKIKQLGGMENLLKLTPEEINKIIPVYIKEITRLHEKRLVELAGHYGSRFQSWDIVNESARDFDGNSLTGHAACSSKWGSLMPGDYTYKAFKVANRAFPKSILLNINETTDRSNSKYVDQIRDLQAKGAGRIDIAGLQFHLFKPQTCLDIAAGKKSPPGLPIWPQQEWDRIAVVAKAGLPMHLSEITITAPGDDVRGRAIQAVIARNLYRLWFSIKPMMGITWWNMVDGCGAPGEPSTSGLFTRNMEPKPAYHALNQLINHDWKTNMTIKAPGSGAATFRGFKGKYKITWQDNSGRIRSTPFHLKTDGDTVTLE